AAKEPLPSLAGSTLHAAIEKIERAHFRTEHDTGSNHHAIFILNRFRDAAGLPGLSGDDLPQWDASVKKYVMPEESRLLSNAKHTDPSQRRKPLQNLLRKPGGVHQARRCG